MYEKDVNLLIDVLNKINDNLGSISNNLNKVINSPTVLTVDSEKLKEYKNYEEIIKNIEGIVKGNPGQIIEETKVIENNIFIEEPIIKVLKQIEETKVEETKVEETKVEETEVEETEIVNIDQVRAVCGKLISLGYNKDKIRENIKELGVDTMIDLDDIGLTKLYHKLNSIAETL